MCVVVSFHHQLVRTNSKSKPVAQIPSRHQQHKNEGREESEREEEEMRPRREKKMKGKTWQ